VALSDLDSHRAEYTGPLGGLTHLHKYLKKWGILQVTVTFACDNWKTMQFCLDFETYPFIKSTYPDFDIIQAFRLSLCPGIKYKRYHVKCHQNKLTQDFWAKMNICVDASTKSDKQDNENLEYLFLLPYKEWRLSIGGNIVCKNVASQVCEFISKTKEPFHHISP
jgi:hypothetical protein